MHPNAPWRSRQRACVKVTHGRAQSGSDWQWKQGGDGGDVCCITAPFTAPQKYHKNLAGLRKQPLQQSWNLI